MRGGNDLLDPQNLESFDDLPAIRPISIPDQIASSGVERESLNQLKMRTGTVLANHGVWLDNREVISPVR